MTHPWQRPLAAQAVARAEPDGCTMFVASNSPMSTNLVAVKQLPYDPVRDFVPVAPLARFPMALVVAAPSPYRTLAELTTQLPGGKLRALAATSRTRHRELPEVPTMIESGNPGYEFHAWVAAFFPAKVDPAIVRKVAAAAGAMLKSPATVALLAGIGGEPMPGGPQELADFQECEIANLRRIAAKVKMEQE